MAVVKIDIVAEDKFTPVLKEVEEKTKSYAIMMKENNGEIRTANMLAPLAPHAQRSAERAIDWFSRVAATDLFIKYVGAVWQALKKPLDESIDKDITALREYITEGFEEELGGFGVVDKSRPVVEEKAVATQKALEDISLAVEDTKENVNAATQAFEELLDVTTQAEQKEVTFNLDGLAELKEALQSLDPLLDKSLNLDISDALEAVDRVKGALASIPETTFKKVVVEYKTKASPVMPFTEGMAHIREMMESLPRGQDYVIDFQGLDALMPLALQALTARQRADVAKARTGIGALAYNPSNTFIAEARADSAERLLNRVLTASGPPTQNVTYQPTFNLDTPWRDLDEYVREIDTRMAELWRTGRSRLMQEMSGGQAGSTGGPF
jgi:hypothetical protein